jgi:hypothetical protein
MSSVIFFRICYFLSLQTFFVLPWCHSLSLTLFGVVHSFYLDATSRRPFIWHADCTFL